VTIAQRIDDAEFLWQAGRREGGFLAALVAFSATARRVRPKATEPLDSGAFKALFQEELSSGSSVRFRGKMTSMDELFYKWLRCELVHEGGLPVGITLDDDDNDGLYTMALSGDFPIAISSVWYHSLLLVVLGHPINSDEFPAPNERFDTLIEKYKIAGQRVLGKAAALMPRPPKTYPNPSDNGITFDLSKDPQVGRTARPD
jgi:hypothetical protein